MTTQPNDPTSLSPAPAPAGLFRRLAAMVYDSLLLMAIGLAYGALVTGLNVLAQGAPPEGEAIQWGVWRLPVFIGLLTVLMGFFYFFWGRSGQTLGMRAWRLKLVDAREPTTMASPKQRLGRVLLAPLSLALFGLGYLWRWLDPERHTLHGRLTQTRILLMPKEHQVQRSQR